MISSSSSSSSSSSITINMFIMNDACCYQERFAGAGYASAVSASGSVVSWGGDVAITAAGGQFRLCWCSGGMSCSVAENFVVDAGKLELIGVAPLNQKRTCVAGQTCAIDGVTGQSLPPSSYIRALDTCGIATNLPRTPDTGLMYSSQVGENAAQSWTAALTASGGQYRLCWCSIASGPCDDSLAFRVDFGELVVLGAAPTYQQRTCVSGRTCAIDGIRGISLSDQDFLMVLDTCGATDLVPRFPFAVILITLAIITLILVLIL